MHNCVNISDRTKLATLYPKLAPLVQDEENLTLALNEEYVEMGEVKRLSAGDTVALIPPISGG
jgi:molybdopterin converting factor small subunit